MQKTLSVLLPFVFLCLSILCACSNTDSQSHYDEGYEAGRKAGHEVGYEEGFSDGQQCVYEELVEEGVLVYEEVAFITEDGDMYHSYYCSVFEEQWRSSEIPKRLLIESGYSACPHCNGEGFHYYMTPEEAGY